MATKSELLIEASLFSAGRPVSVDELAERLGMDRGLIEKNLKKLTTAYSNNDSALEIIKAGNKFSMQVKSKLAEYVKSFAQMEIPEKVLKTAALIAYHQPIKQSELQDMFGSKVYDHVKELGERGLIKRRHEGRTIVITTTSSFSEYFGIDTTDKEKIKKWISKKVKNGKHRNIKEVDTEIIQE
jgi:segregation and condensation protein B